LISEGITDSEEGFNIQIMEDDLFKDNTVNNGK
jgi:hypothetical protein